MKWVRIAFAILSWFFMLGLIVIAFRDPGKAAGLLLMATVFFVNGLLHWQARGD